MRSARLALQSGPPPIISDERLAVELAYLRRVVAKMTKDHALRDELFSAGQLGLAKAVLHTSDRFESYARIAMHNAIRDEIRTRNRQRRDGRCVSLEDCDEPWDTLTPERLLLLKEDASAA